MTQATEKQINFAQSLGIDNAQQYTKEALKSMIDVKVKQKAENTGKTPQDGSNKQIQVIESRHDIVLQRTEKPHSYEFGSPKNRHKIYYGEIAELKNMLKSLEEEGLLEEPIEVQKIN